MALETKITVSAEVDGADKTSKLANDLERVDSAGVITSYSIHYTKLYETGWRPSA